MCSLYRLVILAFMRKAIDRFAADPSPAAVKQKKPDLHRHAIGSIDAHVPGGKP